MQAAEPTEEQIAKDSRLERVIGAILSGAGVVPNPPFPSPAPPAFVTLPLPALDDGKPREV